jgi:dynein heavy chain
LHVVLAFSPVGETFRTRLRQFPSIINCCTIDTFHEWPADALAATAHSVLATKEQPAEQATPKKTSTTSTTDHNQKELDLLKMHGGGLPRGSVVLAEVVQMCMYMHTSTKTTALTFYRQLHRHYHVTPTSYLEMLSTFKDLLYEKKLTVLEAKSRYEIGLQKLDTTASSVNVMQVELEELTPELVKTTKEVDEMMVIVGKETVDAEKIKKVVLKEEEKVTVQVNAATAIKDSCDAELAVAEPVLLKALKALNTLTKSDIVEVKSVKVPTEPVRLTMEAVCIMLGVKPARARDPNDPSKVRVLFVLFVLFVFLLFLPYL